MYTPNFPVEHDILLNLVKEAVGEEQMARSEELARAAMIELKQMEERFLDKPRNDRIAFADDVSHIYHEIRVQSENGSPSKIALGLMVSNLCFTLYPHNWWAQDLRRLSCHVWN